jgi:hypothetical protein
MHNVLPQSTSRLSTNLYPTLTSSPSRVSAFPRYRHHECRKTQATRRVQLNPVQTFQISNVEKAARYR